MRPSLWDEGDRDLLRDAQAYLNNRDCGVPPSPEQYEAWVRFYRLAAPVIRAGVRARVSARADREDCEQEVWAEVVAQLVRSRYDPDRAGLRTWLAVVVRNTAVDFARRRARQALDPLGEESLGALPGRDGDPAAAYEHGRAQVLVRRALDELARQISECSYRVLFLRSIEEREVPEVAAVLGLTPAQVRFRHHRAKQALRRLIEMLEGPSRRGPTGR